MVPEPSRSATDGLRKPRTMVRSTSVRTVANAEPSEFGSVLAFVGPDHSGVAIW
jgi:hypothetical protein